MRAIRHALPLVTRVHRWSHRLSGGRLGHRLPGFRFLLLEHRGRKSGQLRKTPLLYVEDGGRFVVAASNAGQDYHPAWWLNLRADPDACVWIGRRSVGVRARRAREAEAERLWALLTDSWSWFADYREGTDREIPLVVLEPVAAEATGA